MIKHALVSASVALAFAFAAPAHAAGPTNAVRCSEGGDPNATIAACTKAIGSGTLNKVDKARSLHNRALAHARLKQYSPAIADLTQAIEIDPKNGEHHLTRGEISMLSGRYPQAVADIEDGIRIAGPAMRSEYLLGIAQTGNHDLKAAIAAFTAALKFAPREIAILNRRANVYFDTRDYDRALADYTQALAIDPKNALLYYNRAEVWRFTHDLTRARQDLDEAVRLDPKNENIYFRRGLVRIEAHTYPEALADFDKALQIDPHSPAILMHRGIARFFAGRFKDAEADLVASAAAGPQNPYSVLWLYIVRRHQGKNAAADLRAQAKNLDLALFPGPLVSFYLGDIKANSPLLATKGDSDQDRKERLCETSFYLGEEALLRGDRKAAGDYFRRTVATGLHYIMEYQGAAVELQRMGL
ncbi:MAG TPA: tetratricopeptide repeat protein [Alphaproteobacteria bacterium]|nr:tetratricopeptide repeat protein [Alphaproteobacteria bacterium]